MTQTLPTLRMTCSTVRAQMSWTMCTNSWTCHQTNVHRLSELHILFLWLVIWDRERQSKDFSNVSTGQDCPRRSRMPERAGPTARGLPDDYTTRLHWCPYPLCINHSVGFPLTLLGSCPERQVDISICLPWWTMAAGTRMLPLSDQWMRQLWPQPGCQCPLDKLAAQWQGPYSVIEQVSPVTYVIDMSVKKKRKRNLHVNMLKPWHSPVAAV